MLSSELSLFFRNRQQKREKDGKIKISVVLKTLTFNQYQKSDKASFIIYAGFQCLIETTDGCKNNAKNSSTSGFLTSKTS